SSRSVPDNVTSTVVPALAPQGDRTNNFGFGKLFPAGCCPWTVPVNGDNAPITASIMSNGLGPLAKNEKARRMDSSFIDDPKRENISTDRDFGSLNQAGGNYIPIPLCGGQLRCLFWLNDSGNRASGSLDSSSHVNGFAKNGQEIEGR